MIETMERTGEIERLGETLIETAEELVSCRRMADWYLLIEDIERFEMDPAYKPLWTSRFLDLFDALTDLTCGGTDFDGVMQVVEDESAALRCRTPRNPWSHRDD